MWGAHRGELGVAEGDVGVTPLQRGDDVAQGAEGLVDALGLLWGNKLQQVR